MRTENSRSQNSFRRTCPISIYDVAAVETWLEDLARRGEAPVSFTGSRVDLLPDAPRESRFRLQPFRRRKEVLDPERVAAYRSMGWRLVGKLGGVFWVWRCDDPGAPELDTDPVVQGEGYRYLKRRMIFRTVACGLVWLALLGLLVFTVLNLSLRTLLRQGSWLTLTAAPLVAVSLLAVLGVQLWLDARNTWRLWRTLSAGVPLERPKPYRRQLRLGQLVYAATLVVYTLNLMISFQNMGGEPLRLGPCGGHPGPADRAGSGGDCGGQPGGAGQRGALLVQCGEKVPSHRAGDVRQPPVCSAARVWTGPGRDRVLPDADGGAGQGPDSRADGKPGRLL